MALSGDDVVREDRRRHAFFASLGLLSSSETTNLNAEPLAEEEDRKDPLPAGARSMGEFDGEGDRLTSIPAAGDAANPSVDSSFPSSLS